MWGRSFPVGRDLEIVADSKENKGNKGHTLSSKTSLAEHCELSRLRGIFVFTNP